MTTVRRLAILLCGYEILRKSDSTRGRGERFVFASPISAYLLELTSGYLLVDTGVNSAILRDPALLAAYYTGRNWTPPIVQLAHELLPQLAQLGVNPQDITDVFLTHMHMDHTGNLRQFQHASIHVQRREHEYATTAGHAPAWFDIDYDLPALRWALHDGDWTFAPGVQALATYGHTPGHQSLLVTLPETGPVVLVGDVADLAENFAEQVLPGDASDDQQALASIRRINQIVDEHGAARFLCHDPAFVHSARLAPEWYS
ncbi:MAG: N-acyl homoserine lactonase family protein [Roseiflexaceae bacterium]|nr:N-acyl homoserine lactonase family protein [Roseiflexaceae bacterium]